MNNFLKTAKYSEGSVKDTGSLRQETLISFMDRAKMKIVIGLVDIRLFLTGCRLSDSNLSDRNSQMEEGQIPGRQNYLLTAKMKPTYHTSRRSHAEHRGNSILCLHPQKLQKR